MRRQYSNYRRPGVTYTPRQARYLKVLNQEENGLDNFTKWKYRYWLRCATCSENLRWNHPWQARMFILDHRGHDVIMKIKKEFSFTSRGMERKQKIGGKWL